MPGPSRAAGRLIGWAAAVVLGALLVAGLLAPYLYAELLAFIDPHTVVAPTVPPLARGSMLDDYWAVQQIDANTYGIGEPRYYQTNYSYLILGQSRALLFDAGSGTRDLRKVVAGLTTLPLTVLPSHLHFDHLGGIGAFGSVALIDVPSVRADVVDGAFTPARYQFLGMIDRLRQPTVRVSEWFAPDDHIDLGARTLEVLSTPGHTPESVSLYDAERHQLFAGDLIYPTTLYAFLPGASLSQYAASARRLLALLPADTVLWTAHCCRAGEQISAPWLTVADLADLERALAALRAGQLHATGVFPRRYPVNTQMTLATGFPWNNR